MEAVNLLSSLKYSEKQIGYLACTLLLNEEDDLARLIINSVQKDLVAKNELFQCLALAAVCNIGGREMCETLNSIIIKLLTASGKAHVRKRCAITLLRLYRKFPDIFEPEEWKGKVIEILEEKDMSVVTTSLSLLTGLISATGTAGYEAVYSKCLKILGKIVLHREYPPEFVYYSVANPWLQCKALRLLQFFPAPADTHIRQQTREILVKILSNTEMTKNTNKNNASYSILFEAINLIIHLEMDKELLAQSATLLGRFISAREPNIRYLGLETMARLASILEDPGEHTAKLQTTIFNSLRDTDISIRKQALNMIYGMCDRSNAQTVVSELLEYLPTSEFAIRDELVLKIAILAEKFATELSWYIDVMLMLITEAGDFVAPDVWWRVVQIVTNNPSLHNYAAKTVYQALTPAIVPEPMVKVAAYILGEFGSKIQHEISIQQQFSALEKRFATVSAQTRQLLLTSYIKLAIKDASVKSQVARLLEEHCTSFDAELQQRALEYLLLSQAPRATVDKVLAAMPQFPERESSLMRIIRARTAHQTDKLPRAADDSGDAAAPTSVAVDLPAGAPSGRPAAKQTDGMGGLGSLLGDDTPAPAATRSNAQPVATGDSMLDDLLGVSAAPAAPRASQPSSAVDDVMSLLGGGLALSPSSEVPNKQWYERLLTTSEGVLYEDNNLTVQYKSEYHGNQGRVALNFVNKSGSNIENLRTFIPVLGALKVQMSMIQPVLPAGAAAAQQATIECASAFPDAPNLQLSYNVNHAQVQLNLKLPIHMVKFIEPQRLQSADFFKKWGAIAAGSAQESINVFRASKPISADSVTELGRRLQTFKLAVLGGIDPNPLNLVISGLLMTTAGQTGIYIRVETAQAQQMIRLTVRTTSEAVTPFIAKVFQDVLSA
eukprot:TRINITY_DN3633_c0_g1_i1.p1 TRINITY_DN3633_c0_g1~~TRINITY_DN3633_c0_g1_i1.p1  ORF type:complete len:972 (+),score=252.79 TRINITY_DN3633_c0_g1_i1:239-2917(+)